MLNLFLTLCESILVPLIAPCSVKENLQVPATINHPTWSVQAFLLPWLAQPPRTLSPSLWTVSALQSSNHLLPRLIKWRMKWTRTSARCALSREQQRLEQTRRISWTRIGTSTEQPISLVPAVMPVSQTLEALTESDWCRKSDALIKVISAK